MPRPALYTLLALAILGGLFPFLSKGTSELPVYVAGAQRMVSGEEVYRPGEAKAFTYPPFFAMPFVPFTWLPANVKLQRAVWYFANVGMLVWMLALLRRLVSPTLAQSGRRHAAAWFWAAVAALALRHVLAVMQNQSHDFVLAFGLLLAAAAWGEGRALRAGVWVGLCAACKATPLLFGLPFLVRRSVRALIGIVVGCAVASLLPDLLWPRGDGRLWIVAWYEIMVAGISVGETATREGVWHPGSYLNQSLSGTLYRLTTPLDPGLRIVDIAPVQLGEGARKALTIAAQLAVVAIIAAAALRRRGLSAVDPLRALGVAGTVACGMVLLSPMSSKSHFCVLLLPAGYCVAYLMGRRRDFIVLLLCAGAFVVGTLSSKGILGRELGEKVTAAGSVTWCAMLLLLASAHALFWDRGAPAGTEGVEGKPGGVSSGTAFPGLAAAGRT